jgi:hypothetical protein
MVRPVAVVRALTIFAALVALASLPCLIAIVVVGLDEMTYRTGGVVDRLRTLKIPGQPQFDWFGPEEAASIERIAADLRRLEHGLTVLDGRDDPGSEVRREALRRAYETRLQDACRSLGVAEHLDGLTGLDREIERLRIEGVLEAEGLVLRSAQSPGGREPA